MDIRPNYIDGRWQPALGGATRDVVNPATGEVIARVTDSRA